MAYFRHSCSLNCSNGANEKTPALFTSTSRRPKAFFASATTRCASDLCATSPCTAMARPPLPVISRTTRSALHDRAHSSRPPPRLPRRRLLQCPLRFLLKRLSLSQPYCRAVSWHHLIRRRRCKLSIPPGGH